jgi:hypothetical protein
MARPAPGGLARRHSTAPRPHCAPWAETLGNDVELGVGREELLGSRLCVYANRACEVRSMHQQAAEPEPDPQRSPQPQPRDVPAIAPDSTRTHADHSRFAVNALTLASFTRNLAINVRNLSEQEIWLEAFSGDFAAQARAQGLLESASGILSFVSNPLLGGVSDSFGRKPLMNFAPVVSTFSCSLMALSPGVPALEHNNNALLLRVLGDHN